MVPSMSRHPLFTNPARWFSRGVVRARSGRATRDVNTPRNHAPRAGYREPDPRTSQPASMPCRKEDYIFLEQSVSVDSKEVDALVTKIGEALQLHNNNNNSGGGAHQKTVSVSVSCLTGRPEPVTGGGAGGGAGGPPQRRRGCCVRLRSHRASPYRVPGGGSGEPDWIRPWRKTRKDEDDDEEDDPHRMLQELILSGNLIKEAVRRLQVPEAASGPS